MAAESCSGDVKGDPGGKYKQCVLSSSCSMKSGRLQGRAHENNVGPSKSCWKPCGGNPASLPRRVELTRAAPGDPDGPSFITVCMLQRSTKQGGEPG